MLLKEPALMARPTHTKGQLRAVVCSALARRLAEDFKIGWFDLHMGGNKFTHASDDDLASAISEWFENSKYKFVTKPEPVQLEPVGSAGRVRGRPQGYKYAPK